MLFSRVLHKHQRTASGDLWKRTKPSIFSQLSKATFHFSARVFRTNLSTANYNAVVQEAGNNHLRSHRSYILLGPPGCGKGTQGRAIGSLPGFFHCACGDVFRALPPNSPLGQTVAGYSSRGELVPDEITVELWTNYISECVRRGSYNPDLDKLLLDGIPRNTAQARLLNDALDVKGVFYLECSDMKVLVNRIRNRSLRENRLDDAREDVIRHRLEVFARTAEELLRFYPSNIVRIITADQPPAKVLHEIVCYLRFS